jgi:outer membrane cobalamin receptor
MAKVGAKGFRAALMAGAGIALLWAAPAFAQQRQHFDLPAGDAAQRVRAVATQSGTQVIAPNADLAGIRTRPVRGDYSAAEALRLMLAGTGLEVNSNNGALVITRAAAQSPAMVPASPPEEALASEPPPEQNIVVTGTRIHRMGVDTVQAASVVDSAEIERRAYTNALQALQDTPGFGAPGNSQLQASQGNLGVAQSFSNFFGLGSQRTLTLVNSRRFVSSNSVSGTGAGGAPGSQVDLNLMPVGLIDRIETVAIGGAPVYGSDAIAGTVNVILKEDYDGIKLTGLASVSERGDAANQTVRGLFGKNFAEGRGNIVLGAEYVRQEGMKLNGRFPAFLSLVSSGDTDRSNGIPALTVIDQRIALLTEGGLPFRSGTLPADATYITAGGIPVAAGGQPLMFGNGSLLVPYVRGARFTGDSGGLFRNGGDGLNPADHQLLLSPNHRYLLNALGNFDVTPGINLFFEASYAHTSGTKLSDLFQFAAPGVGGPSLNIRADNPFLPQQTRDILAANGIAGATTFRMNRNLNDIADSRPARTELDVWRVVVGAKGKFGVGAQEWNWDLSYNVGHSKNRSEFNQINQTRFLNAIDAVSTTQCRVGGSCVPLNIFGVNQFTPEAAAYVIDQGVGISRNMLSEAVANLGGALPFGIAEPIRFNLGYTHRKESGSFTGNDIINGGLTLLGGGAAFPDAPKRGFNTDEIYGETVIPLVDDEMNLPLVKRLEFEGAARYVHHSVAGGDVTWSAGGRFQPRIGKLTDGLTIRGVFTHSIRAPSIVELFLNATPVARAANDVCASTRVNSGPNPSVRLANCTAALAAVGAGSPNSFTPTTNGSSPFGVIGGNPNLENERANSWSLGFVWQPPAVPRLRVSLDYSRIKLKGAISRFTLISAQTACYDSPAYPNEGACDAFHRLTAAEAAAQSAATGRNRIAGDIADAYQESYFNTAKMDFAGFIGEIDYRVPVANLLGGSRPGSIAFGLKAFRIEHYRTQQSGAAPVLEAVGTVGTPRWRLNARLGFNFHPVDWDIQVIYNSRQVGDRTLTIEDTPINDYGRYTTVNSSLGFRVEDNFRLQFSVRNLLDRKIPYPATVTRAFGVFDPIGRSYSATATIDF